MSRWTKHPKTKRWDNALWIDDYFGSHHYGVRFGEEIFDPWEEHFSTIDSAKDAAILNEAYDNA